MISFELTTYAKKHYKTKQAKANQNGGKLLIIYNIIFITFHWVYLAQAYYLFKSINKN